MLIKSTLEALICYVIGNFVRLWMASHKQQVSRKLKLKRFESKPKKKLKANQKLPNKRQGIVKRHLDYQDGLRQKLTIHLQIERSRVESLDKAINKLYLLDLDNLLPIVKPLYPDCGRPAKNQQGIIRSLILMLELREYSITKWALRVRNDKCSDSPYGRVIYLKPNYDPRMFTPVPRHSKAFKDKFKTRTSVERSNKRMFVDYSIESAHSRSSLMRFAMATFSVINIHLDAWVKSLGFNLLDTLGQAA